MRIKWYGTASLCFESAGRSLLIDPFGQLPIGRKAKADSLNYFASCYGGCENILVTHGHADHIAHFGNFFKDKPVKIYTTETPSRTLVHHGIKKEQLCTISPGWQGSVAGMTVKAFQGRHCRFDLPQICRVLFSREMWSHIGSALYIISLVCAYPEHGESIFYEIEADSVRVQIMGSMNLDDRTDYPTGADVLILPLQGRSDQDTYALGFVERLRPKEVWLDHYDNAFPPLSGDVETGGFVRNTEEKFGIRCRPMIKGKWFEI